jgi:hypothetical protein
VVVGADLYAVGERPDREEGMRREVGREAIEM